VKGEAGEQDLEDGVRDEDRSVARLVGRGKFEEPAVELLGGEDGACAVPPEKLGGLAVFGEEDEEGAAAGFALHALAHQASEPFHAEAHVDGLEGDEDLDAVGDHEATPARAETTARRRAGSKPVSTRTRAKPTSRTRGAARRGAASRRTKERAVEVVVEGRLAAQRERF
jgi:hypothetical protein